MPSGITIIGLGPSGNEHWTQAAQKLLGAAKEVHLRTTHHPSASHIPGQIHTFDHWYQQNSSLDQVHDQVAAEVVRLGQRPEGVIYAVPGHPNVGQSTVPRIRTLASEANLAISIIPGLSYIDATFTALNMDTPGNLQIADAREMAALHHPALEPGRPALITYVGDPQMAARLKQTLLNAYPGDFEVILLLAMGTKNERHRSCALSSLDKQSDFDSSTMLYFPTDNTHSNFSAFQETIAHLRAPDGCPWDREQTHQSLRPFLLEETYEVLEALDANDPSALAEELGDLLLQIVLHTQIAIDTGQFNMGTVIDHINRKLWRRHPHIFGNMVINGVADVTANWEAIKKTEKVAKGRSAVTISALDGVPEALPALAQAMAISKKVVRAGFEWPNIEGVLDKVIEEAGEIAAATEPNQLESEIGDLLFSLVNLARWRQVDPESALRSTNARFSRRFKKMEALAAAENQSLSDMTIEDMNRLWDEAKNQ